MRLTTRIIRSEFTPEFLRTKLQYCGTFADNGIQCWCRSPMCDRCRRYRARWTAQAVAGWTSSIIATHRLLAISATTSTYTDPSGVLAEVAARRRSLRRAVDHRQRHDDRWRDLQLHAVWMPRWDGAMWSAEAHGVAYLGHVGEVRFLDSLGDRHGLRLQAFPRAVISRDIHDLTLRSMTCAHGLADADDEGLVAMATEIDRRAGYKGLLMRRGLQGGQP